jgi:hypothetical protein
MPRSYLEDDWGDPVQTRVEAVSNISTIALRVVGGDEKGTQLVGYNWAYKYGDLALRVVGVSNQRQ